MAPKASALLATEAMLASMGALSVGGGLAGAGVAGFLGWAFPGVGPSPEAEQLGAAKPPTMVKCGLTFGGTVPPNRTVLWRKDSPRVLRAAR